MKTLTLSQTQEVSGGQNYYVEEYAFVIFYDEMYDEIYFYDEYNYYVV